MSIVNKTALKKLAKEQTGMRVSAEAIDKLTEILTDTAVEIIKEAADLAKHAKRKTIKVADIKLVVR
jgi:histone H3/H4